MKTISTPLRDHLNLRVTSMATICRIIRQDGTAANFFMTDHDVDIPFDDGDGLETYQASDGYSLTAIANNVGMGVDNMDLTGLFSALGVDEAELRAGLFDHAEIRVSAINWADTSQGVLKMRRGRIGQITLSPTGVFTAEIRGLTSPLGQNIVGNYQAECRTDLGSPKCQVPIRPPVIQRGEVVEVGDYRLVATKSTAGIVFNSLLFNPNFEQGVLGTNTPTIDGWIIVSGQWSITVLSGALGPQGGSQYLMGANDGALAELLQVVDLTGLGLDLTSVDAGNVTMDFSGYRANAAANDTGRILVTYLDNLGAPVGVAYDSTTEAISPVNSWVARSASAVAVPATTRSVKVQLYGQRITGSKNDAAFDTFDMSLTDNTLTNGYQDIYENTHYECITGGTTHATTEPTYDTVEPNETIDGTVTFIARNAWTRDAVVNDVIDRVTMLVTLSDARAIDDWFSNGAVYVETGPNTGVVREIKKWTSTTQRLELYLPTPLPLTPGVKIRVYPGCDKRDETCRETFTNILNFRGFQFVPGTDAIGGTG